MSSADSFLKLVEAAESALAMPQSALVANIMQNGTGNRVKLPINYEQAVASAVNACDVDEDLKKRFLDSCWKEDSCGRKYYEQPLPSQVCDANEA